ncbi:Stk1 family PASTA domain-containing Ser/Thr kinase [soil metagenome]
MIGRLIDGRYQVRSRIARGGMATVYLATDLRLERRVAIKIMHGHLADDSQFKERFIQEARSAARLAHPNVVNVFDQGQDSDMAYLVMEYLPGITLRDLLQEHKSLTSEQTLDILEAVLSGLAAAHKAGIVHRDLKPENVLLADDGRIKIGDFGLARAASANTATGAALLGTIAYLSPELVTRGIADTRSDIYAVGIMMYEMLAGEQPFKGEQPMQIAYQHANSSVPTPSTKNPRVPAELDELVLWATAREPDQRPRDARVMLDQLLETQAQLQTALPTEAMTTQHPRVPQRTVAMPVAETMATQVLGSDAETQVLGAPRGSGAASALVPAALATEATTALAEKSGKRRARGWWLFALVLLLAGIGGGTGWYFGAGPGGHVTIPKSVIGLSPSAASTNLQHAGLEPAAKRATVYSMAEKGSVVATKPRAGSSVARGSSVTLVLSNGPKPVAVPALAGQQLDAAKKNLAAAHLVFDEKNSVTQFSKSKYPAGQVIHAYGIDKDGKQIALAAGDTYFENSPVTLLSSLGPLPAVRGLSISAAQAALRAVNVTGVEGGHTFSDTVDKGEVISASPTVEGAATHPGDQVILLISDGPDLVDVPAVAGDTIQSATDRLKAAGFTVAYDTTVPQIGWGVGLFKVQSITGQDANNKAKRGATITIVANY